MSITCSGTPSIWIVSLTLSRVVPGIGVTMASSAPASALSSELLPTLGWPAITTVHALAQQRALARARRAPRRSAASMAVELAPRIGLLEEVDLLLGEVQRGLDQHAQAHDALGAAPSISAEKAPLSERAGRARRGLGAGVDQVGHRLGLRQVELVVEEGALGEFAGLRPAAGRCAAPASRQRASSSCSTHRAAVRLQLQHVFAGVRMRRREVDRQARGRCGWPSAASEGQQRGLARLPARGRTAPAISGARSRPEARTMPTAPRPGAVAMATMGSWWRPGSGPAGGSGAHLVAILRAAGQ